LGHTILIVLRSTFNLPRASLVPLEEGCTRLCKGIKERRASKKEGTHDIGVENDLLHYMCVIREQEIDAVLKIVIKICG
jgi:hypothetical protein